MGRAPVGEADIDARRKELLGALDDPAIEVVDVKGISGARTSMTFFGAELPGAGFGVYSLSPEIAADSQGTLSASPKGLENDYYSVKINADGGLDILDKESGAEFRGCLQLVDEGDRGDSYNFDGVPAGEIIRAGAGSAGVSIVESGPVRATLRLDARMSIPQKLAPGRDERVGERIETKLTTLVSLYADIKRIDFRTTFDNECEDHRLRVVFNAPYAAPEILVESTFDIVRRPTRVEAGEGCVEMPIGTSPQKTFSCIEAGGLGMALFNRGIPEIEASAGDDATAMALTLVRSTGWLSREDLVSRPEAAGPTVEAPGAQAKGPHDFEYAFTSYRGGFVEAEVTASAHAYAFPPQVAVTNSHKGRIKGGASLVETGSRDIVLSALEPAKLKGAYLARLYNSTGLARTARLKFWGRVAGVYEVNLLEQRRSKEPLKKKAGKIDVEFRPGEIKTFQVVLKK
jgi:alpha-mannosidase